MTDYHEAWEALSDPVKNAHRALTSLKEEIEAVDWYHQRVAVCDDPELASVLAHNRDEEMEHACMTLEWLRRNMPGWDEQLRTYLFSSGPIVKTEERLAQTDAAEAAPAIVSPGGAGLRIGSLKGK